MKSHHDNDNHPDNIRSIHSEEEKHESSHIMQTEFGTIPVSPLNNVNMTDEVRIKSNGINKTDFKSPQDYL